MNQPSIIITGSSGTVGNELAEQLLERDYEVTGVDYTENRWSDRVDQNTVYADLRKYSATNDLPDDADLIVHLAANARVHKLIKNPNLAKENIETTYNIAEYARRSDTNIVFASSREVYGNRGKLIYNESDTYIDECESPYTASKIAGESVINAYQECYDIESCILRFSNVYGRFDASDRVVPLFIAQATRGENMTIYGSSKVLDFTYLDDCVNGIISTIENFEKAKRTTFNIASGTGTSLLKLAELIIEHTNSKSTLSVKPNRTGEINRYVADISKAQKILDFHPSHSLKSGLEQTTEWYQRNDHLFDDILDQE